MRALLHLLAGLTLAAAVASFPSAPRADPTIGPRGTVFGVGGTLPATLYKALGDAYAVAGRGDVEYRPMGTGAGLKSLPVDPERFGYFVSADTPRPGRDTVGLTLMPVAVGGILPVANIPGVAAGTLTIDGGALVRILTGAITFWDDASLEAMNPTVPLPHQPITVLYRADDSGTTEVFTRYLGKFPGWPAGSGSTVRWPTGRPVATNDGLGDAVAATAGAIGYVSFDTARAKNLAYLDMTTSLGHVVQPSPNAFQSAAVAAPWDPDTLTADLTATADPAAWPITAPTYAYVASKGSMTTSPARRFLAFALTDGQSVTADAGFIPLPGPVAQNVLAILNRRSQ